MGQISQFLREGNGFILHYCPACLELHAIHTDRPNELGCMWVWDRHIVSPTFSPSIKIETKRGNRIDSRCHYMLHAGVLEFFADCTHHLKGLKVPLPALPMHMRDSRW